MAGKRTLVLMALLIVANLPSPVLASKQKKHKHRQRHEQSNQNQTAPVQAGGSAASGISLDSGTTKGVFSDQFDPGTASLEEKTAIERVLPGTNPRTLISAYLKTTEIADQPTMLRRAQLAFIKNESLVRIFPSSLFYVLRFPQWPIAMNTPPPLASNNIFLVDKSQAITFFTSKEGLEDLFKKKVSDVGDADSARHVVRGWLALSQELLQDGMFRFLMPDSGFTVKETGNTMTAVGKIVVDPSTGNSGEIVTSLVFAGGKLQEVHEIRNLKTGMRPICQSQKLLDPDTTVRRMAEQDLLIMGKAAGPYLTEQRAKSTPEIQQAIDCIWKRILQEDR